MCVPLPVSVQNSKADVNVTLHASDNKPVATSSHGIALMDDMVTSKQLLWTSNKGLVVVDNA